MNVNKLFEFAINLGELMLINGAETYRVEDTLNRILSVSNLSTIDSVVMPTVIFATIGDDSIQSISVVKRVHRRGVHLNKVALANDLSRRFCSNSISLDNAISELKEIEKKSVLPVGKQIVTIGVMCGSFSFLFGATLLDMVAAFLVGLILGIIQTLLRNITRTNLVINVIGGATIALFSVFFNQYLHIGSHLDLIIVGSMMPLVPGVAITNAIRDTIQGDYLSGLSRAADAFVIAAGIAVGVGTVLKVFYLLS